MSNTKTDENKYYFRGIRFIPSYRDFDLDDAVIHAKTTEEAWSKLDILTKLYTWKSVSLIEINNVRYYESV